MHAHNSISSSVQYSYSCHYFSPCGRRLCPLLSFPPSCLPFALSYPSSPHYFIILLSLSSGLELGRRLRSREQTAQVSRFFFCFLPIFDVPYLYHFILYSMLHTLFPPHPKIHLLVFCSSSDQSPVLVSPPSGLNLFLFSSSPPLRFSVCNCHIV